MHINLTTVIGRQYSTFVLRCVRLKALLCEISDSQDSFNMVASMTLIMLMLYGGDFWYIKQPITVLCLAGLFYRPLRSRELFWLMITVILAAGNVHNWYLIDNHKYLINYWCLAMYLSCLSHNPIGVLAVSARYLIGLTFLFATIWKAISNDYLDGVFFHYSLLLDDRFTALSDLVGAIGPASDMANQQAVKDLLQYSSTMQSVQLTSTYQVAWIAHFLTWWTILFEGLIAMTYLWPQGSFISRWRDYFLLLFVLTTYAMASVIGFGWTLIIMGAAQSTLDSRYNRILYIVAFFMLQLYLVPWQNMLSYYLQPSW